MVAVAVAVVVAVAGAVVVAIVVAGVVVVVVQCSLVQCRVVWLKLKFRSCVNCHGEQNFRQKPWTFSSCGSVGLPIFLNTYILVSPHALGILFCEKQLYVVGVVVSKTPGAFL